MTADVPTLVAGAVGVAVILVLGRVALIPSNRLGVSVFHPYRDDPWPAGVQEDDDARFRWTRRPEATREAEPEDALEHVAFRPPRAARRDPETPAVRGDRRTRRGRPAPGTRRRPPCASLIAARRAAERPRCRSTRPAGSATPCSTRSSPTGSRAADACPARDRSRRGTRPPTGTGFKGGDLYGVADHLDHIADLGANAIYLNPIFASTANHRYHTCDYLRIDPLLGGEAAFRHLLDAAHARGIRVVIDGVFNHCGRGFYPFQHVLETGAASPYRDWFFLNPAFLEPGRSIRAYPDGAEPVLELSAVDLGDRDGSATFRDLGYQAWWDLPALPKLNVRNPEVREYLLAAGEHWIRFGVDGWRLDVPEDLEDPDFWREFRRRIRAIDPEAYILAEIWFPKAEVLRGDQYDATMNYPFLTAVVSFAAGSHLDLAVAAQHGWLGAAVRPLDGPGFAALLGPLMTELDPDVVAVQYNLLGSHDTPRLLTLAGGDAASVRLAALVQATLPGAPAVYYGDEIGMTGSIDPAARAAFPWDRPETWDDSIRASLRAAFALRHEQPVLRDGSFRLAGAQGSMVAWVRALDEAVALVVLNNGDAAAKLAVEAPELAGRWLQAAPLPGDDAPAPFAPASAAFDVSMPARTGRVFLG